MNPLVVLVVLPVLGVTVGVVVGWGRPRVADHARTLQWVALLWTVVADAILVAIEGEFHVILLVPVAIAAVPIATNGPLLVDWLAAVGLYAWSIMVMVGQGLYILQSALLMLIASGLQTGRRRSRSPAAPEPSPR